jgi:hypothetical protein
MFLKSSRYNGLETVEAVDRQGRAVRAVKRRPLPITSGSTYSVQGPDQLDVLAHQQYKDGTRFWHIADANSELEANELTRVASRAIQVPDK